MASQHPDHAGKPYWHTREYITAQHENEECYLTYSDLGIEEYKWDWEGKLVDESVMERLLGKHYEYFKKNPLGKEKFLTFRLPNPKAETEFRLARAFINIISASALAKKVGFKYPPLFEVILPMTESAQEMIATQEAFAEISDLKHSLYRIDADGIKNIEIIPLFEQVETIINSDKILIEYLKLFKEKFGKTPKYMRPYIARSDPALNSGLIPSVIAAKIALSHYKTLSKKIGIELYPIIGTGSLPFRGGLTPISVKQFINEYRGIKTALLQSGFRYDYDKKSVIKAVKFLNSNLPKTTAITISAKEEKDLRLLLLFFEAYYKETVEKIAGIINKIASDLPKRRERVQHIGLFGYSRGMGKVKLPRAIGFTAALYTIGVPPELIGSGKGIRKVIELKKIKLLEKHYKNLKIDLLNAGRFLNKENLAKLSKKSSVWKNIEEDVKAIESYLGKSLKPETKEEKQHQKLTSEIFEKLEKNQQFTDLLIQAAILRKSLG